MKQTAFEARYAAAWRAMELWLDRAEGKKTTGDAAPLPDDRFPAAYRQVCNHLAVSRLRGYSPALQDRLNLMALRGHRFLYAGRPSALRAVVRFIGAGFPVAFRRHWPFMLASLLLFGGPFAALLAAVLIEPSLVYSVLPQHVVVQTETMYDPANDVLGRERAADTDFAMFGYYVFNNIGIAFRAFAGGILAGLGTVLTLVFNGVFIGAVAGHLTGIGFTETFWPFVVGHGAFELTAIVIVGGAGLRLGYGLLAPGRFRRRDAVVRAALDALPLVYGATAMLLVAAVIEAFWSSTTWVPVGSKYLVGASLWLLVALYLFRAGRPRAA